MSMHPILKKIIIFALFLFAIGFWKEPLRVFACQAGIAVSGNQCIVVLTTPGTSTWTVPLDWSNQNTVEIIGGGGSGAAGAPSNANGSGGGGGAYAKKNNVSLWGTVTYGIGNGGASSTGVTGNNGGDTWFCNATTNCGGIASSSVVVGAKGGSGSGNSVGGAGGASSTSVGDVRNAGGTGGSSGGGIGGDGGGGAGGPYGTGGAGGFSNFVGGTNTRGGGGGGGDGGGGAGGNSTTTAGGAGGTNFSGGGSGTPGPGNGGNGSSGGGGAGGGNSTSSGGNGSTGTEWSIAGPYGSGAGGGAAGDSSGSAGLCGLYGGGGAGTGNGNSSAGSAGCSGIIVITYTPRSQVKLRGGGPVSGARKAMVKLRGGGVEVRYETVAFVQSSTAGFSSTISHTATFPASSNSGDIIAFMTQAFTASLPTVTSTCVAGNNLTIIQSATSSAAGGVGDTIGYGIISVSGSCSVTASYGSVVGNSIAIEEIRGVSILSPIDSSTISTMTTVTPPQTLSSGNITTTHNGDFVFAVLFDPFGNGVTWTAEPNYILRHNGNERTFMDEVQSSAGVINATGTPSATLDGNVGIEAFEPASNPAAGVYFR